MPEQALTDLNEEERFFFETVRRFALDRIGPHVRRMDEEALFPRELITELFELGLMGINIPEELGGQEGSFFMTALAVEALATVDPSAALIVDVQNTLVANAIINWGSDEQKRKADSGCDGVITSTVRFPPGDF